MYQLNKQTLINIWSRKMWNETIESDNIPFIKEYNDYTGWYDADGLSRKLLIISTGNQITSKNVKIEVLFVHNWAFCVAANDVDFLDRICQINNMLPLLYQDFFKGLCNLWYLNNCSTYVSFVCQNILSLSIVYPIGRIG